MPEQLEPLQAPSLADIFVERFEELILSGRYAIGQQLPSERELALQLGVSRPVVHKGLMQLAQRGLVSMRPRVGTVVNDYRREGSLSLLTSLLNYQKRDIDPHLLQSLLAMRSLIETETARLAAQERTHDDLQALRELVHRERSTDPADLPTMVALDFSLHHQVALASGNLVYPMLMKSFEPAYTNLSGIFFADPVVHPVVVGLHAELLDAIEHRRADEAGAVMTRLLRHGEEVLIQRLATLMGDDE